MDSPQTRDVPSGGNSVKFYNPLPLSLHTQGLVSFSVGIREPKERNMGLWDALKGQLIDVIEWNDDTRDTMVWRFPRRDNEIKNGARLIVRESQVAAFVNEGQLADVFQPGTY